MDLVQYNHAEHIYTYRGERYLSATQVLGLVKQKFEAETVAEEYAKKAGRTAEDWIQSWDKTRDKSLVRGNAIHDLREFITNNRSIDIFHGKAMPVRNADRFPPVLPFISYPDGIYTERMVWDHQYKIAGRCDKFAFETIGKHRYVHIDDYKTNRLIRFTSFYNPSTQKYKMLLPPLDHLMDCEAVVYGLQLSIYAKMFMSHGFRVGELRIIHFPHIPSEAPPGAKQPEPKIYNMEFMGKDVRTLLDYQLKQRNGKTFN